MLQAGLTNTLAMALPSMCMPVLFGEIAKDLHLNLVQVGMIWGIGALPGLAMSLVGGMISDRLGAQRVLSVACVLAGLLGALRGASTDFYSLAATIFFFSFISYVIPVNNVKMCGMWLPSRQLGLASAFLSMGMALGFILGSLVSATVLSPWLGSWRYVLYLYGALTVLVSIPWFFTPATPPQRAGSSAPHPPARPVSIWQSLAHVIKVPNIILIGLALLGIGGCIQSSLGYLPLYLRGLGWSDFQSDSTVASFHIVSLIFTIPIALWSNKLGTRKRILIGATLLVILGWSLLAIGRTGLVWLAVLLAGMTRDGFMAVYTTMVLETRGIGPAYAGTAFGVTMVISNLGNLLAPPAGNSLASISPGLPFLFWAGLAALGLLFLFRTQDTQPATA